MPRVMLSSQRLWPSSCNSWVGFMDCSLSCGIQRHGNVPPAKSNMRLLLVFDLRSRIRACTGFGVLRQIPDGFVQSLLEVSCVQRQQIANVVQGDLRRRIFGQQFRIARVMTLSHKNRGQPLAPMLFQRIDHAQLVLDDHIMPGRKAPLDIVQHGLLVHVDQYAALYRIGDARYADLARLQYRIAIGQYDRRAESRYIRDGFERFRVQLFRERIIQQKLTQILGAHLVAAAHAETLERAEIIRIADLIAQLFVKIAIELAPGFAKSAFDVRIQIGVDAVVVQQCVVHVEQEDEVARRIHLPFPFFLTTGLCHPSSPAVSSSAAFGPQVPGLYCRTLSASFNAGSMMRHAASMPSSRPNNSALPRNASPSRRAYGNRTRLGCARAISSTFSPRIASPGFLTRTPAEITTSGLRRKRK